MVVGLGVDIVKVSRVAAVIRRRGFDKFAAKILSPEELSSYVSRDDASRTRFLAVRWAVKEAAYKALYPTVKVTWKDLTFVPLGGEHPGSKPHLVLCPDKSGPITNILSSVSHDGDYVLASVIVA